MNVTSISFPYGESIHWFSPQKIDSLPDSQLKEWLLATGSLTLRLKTHCNHFEVKVLGEHLLEPLADEFPAQTDPVWVREVLLCLDGIPWVFARTLIPQTILSTQRNDNQYNDFTRLGTRSLGELLFTSPDITPGNIEVAQFKTCGRLAALATSLNQHVNSSLWGRRRYFNLHNSQLIVSEIFLPAAVDYINQSA
ncbi:chorismate--pyruvate lyase [Shewanella sp. Actino-trap-3]|uniref:chorismate--pyruvate lyase family protein n=1 Tax=Shewanella sp. Actino-trap-3 TaxID=2058331 RepID=UPI000C340E48|nr:chorismate lyase [Shewanella sp. Actino-trap-3]PKG79384.1 chorismate--pyruvate lyase [Shewanella sp. Actino-trap-3]|tara:strand:+ start:25523 stop:26107 length:585 start_codon:yes stop_codon:yes gene_type:complete